MKKIIIILIVLLVCLHSDAQKVNYKQQTTIGTSVKTVDVTLQWVQHLKTIDSLKIKLSNNKELDSLKKVIIVYKTALDPILGKSLDNYFQIVSKNTPKDAIFASSTVRTSIATDLPLGFFLRYKDGDSIYSIRVLQFNK